MKFIKILSLLSLLVGSQVSAISFQDANKPLLGLAGLLGGFGLFSFVYSLKTTKPSPNTFTRSTAQVQATFAETLSIPEKERIEKSKNRWRKISAGSFVASGFLFATALRMGSSK